MKTKAEGLARKVAETVRRDIDPRIGAMAGVVARAHQPGVLAVIAYGSCLRDVDPAEGLIDLYVLTDGFTSAGFSAWARLGCRLMPPNVYYAETTVENQTLRAKYAVLPLYQCETLVRPEVGNPYFWARFSQPVALVTAKDESARKRIIAILCQAVRTMHAHCRQVSPGASSTREIWEKGLAATYATELRAEDAGRGQMIYAANSAWFEEVSKLVESEPVSIRKLPGLGRWRRLQGKAYSVARLTKAAFTFSGGADYLVWKISRHSGHRIELTDWQRRHPVLASITLLPRLIRSGAVR